MKANIKLTFHEGNQVWSKVIGKRLSKNVDRLIQAQWYFTPNLEAAQTLAAARKAEWRKLKKGWAGHKEMCRVHGDPFPDIPHWYGNRLRSPQESSDSTAVEMEFRRESQPDQSLVAEMYGEIDISECACLFREHRVQREGIDFKSTTNKSFKIDLDGALRAIDTGIKMVDLVPADLDGQRVTLLKTCGSSNTAKNYGRAMKMMLDWYYDSPYFFGGTTPKGVSEVFARYPRKRPAKPEHLPTDRLKTVLAAASTRRRLYLLLMLNTGMQPTDIPHLPHDAFDLRQSLVKWHRQKNERVKNPSDHEITSHLWPETMHLVRELLCCDPGPAFRTVDGKPLYHESSRKNRQNAVAKGLAKFFKKVSRDHNIAVSAKNFRQTGAQLIQEVTDDYSLSQIWLGRKFKIVDRPYLRQVYDRLGEASSKVRERLHAAGVFTSVGGQAARKLAKGRNRDAKASA
jgi:integrase